jgi:tRNA-binding protein
MATYEDFQKLDIRVGKIIEVEDFPKAKSPKYKFKVDFGPEIGIKKSCSGYCEKYTKEDLKGRLIIGVVNFPARQIGPELSEVLILGVDGAAGECILLVPDKDVPIGGKMY